LTEHDEPAPFTPPEPWAPTAPSSYEVLSNDAGALTTTVVPGGDAEQTGSRRRRFVALGAAVALVIGVGAGAVAVAGALDGGGAQPETVVPANAVFYAELDLDPSAGQKVDAFRFLRKFPALKDAFTADGGYGPDFAKLFEGSDIDYAKDVQPWLGKRFAAALVPGDADKAPARLMVVVQTTDEAKAEASLTEALAASNEDHVSLAVSGGYVVLATTLDLSLRENPGDSADDALAQQLLDEAGKSSLADAAAYKDAVGPLGDSVATVWVDNKGVADVTSAMASGLSLGAGALGLGPATGGTGTSVAVLRFDGAALELVGSTTDSTYAIPSGGVPALSSLPESTLVAVGGNDVGTFLQAAYGPVWDQLGSLALGGSSSGAGMSEDQIEEFCKELPDDCDAFKEQFGEQPGGDPFGELGPAGDPDQWPTLFGDQTVVAVGGDGSEPSVGVHVVGGNDTLSAVEELVAKAEGQVTLVPVADGVVVASDPAWAAQLAQPGRFGDSADFREAVPDAAGAGIVAFVDVDGLIERFGADLSAEDRANLEPLKAVGVTVTSTSDGTTYRVRVLSD
jgi:hypothetical protein